jgi:uncharacterized protein affecting Mg2+/Co2+ transport
MLPRSVPSCFLFALMWCVGPALGHESPVMEVIGRYDNALGSSDAASEGVIGAEQLGSRPLLRPAEVLEYIPGMVVTQHSGDGKANQYFLRGMNLDHGTDFATTVNGVPVNLPSHAHGQGYSDLNFLIPELVSRVDYRKGPYAAADGDFSSAGSAHFVYRTRLERPLAEFTLGPHGYQRAWVAGSKEVGEGVTLLLAGERLNNNGPWTVPEGLRKANAQLILSGGSAREGWSTSLSAYSAHWNATDQVPQRLIDAGSYLGQAFGRFDSLDASDGASTRRTSFSGRWHRADEREMTQVTGYLLQYDLSLFSNFTYRLERASDQFAQTDHRTVLGGHAFHSWFAQLDGQRTVRNTLGVQLRQDRIQAALFDTVERQIQTMVRDDGVRQTQLGVYAENETGWLPWLRSVAGLRADQASVRVISHIQPQNSGSTAATQLSPKLSVILGPWQKTEFFLHAGRGFHSNDARGATARVDPRTGLPIDPVPLLVGSRGQEIGLKSEILAGWQTTLALWRLDFDSELVYVGDAGNTEPGRPSRRIGVEWAHHWMPGEHGVLDASLAWTRPRYTDSSSAGQTMVNTVQKVAHLNLRLRNMEPWSGSLGVRYIGAAPLTEDGAVHSAPSLTANLRIQRKLSNDLDLALDVLNLTNRQNNDISYFYTSRLVGEPAAGVADVHVHPAEPRTVRLTARLRF